MPGRRERLAAKGIHEDLRRIARGGGGTGTAGLSAHQLLGQYHSDAAIAAPVEGAMILGDDTPEWNALLHPAAAGQALVTGATTFAWDPTPIWTDDHTWDKGASDSPALVLIGGTNDDTAKIYLGDDAVAGNSDLVVQLVANDDDARLIVEQLGGTDVAYISGAGNAWFEGDVMLTDDAFVGLSGGGRFVFDATPAPDQIDITDADLYFATAAHGIIHVDGVAAGAILVADGTRYAPGTIADAGGAPNDAQYLTLALDGDLSAERRFVPGDGLAGTDGGANGDYGLVVDLVAAWSGLEFSGGDLRIDLDATFNAWTAIHTHAEDIVLDDGGGNSPQIRFITGSDDEIKLYADDTNGDCYLLLSEAAGASGFYVRDSAGGYAMDCDSNGNLTVAGTITVPQYIIHDGDADTYINFTTDEITLRAGGADLLTLTEDATDTVLFGAQADLNGNDLILDTDGDSYLHASGDDVVDLVLAAASGEFGIHINGAEDFTFTANSLNVLAGSVLVANSATVDSNFSASIYAIDSNIGVSKDDAPGGFLGYVYGADADDYPLIQFRRSHGARGSESAAQADEVLGRFGAGGYGATGFASESTGYLQVNANQNFTDANMGTSIKLATTPNNSTTPAEVVKVTANARVKVGGTAGASGKLDVDQNDAAVAIPVLYLKQTNTGLPFIQFDGTAGAVPATIVAYGAESTSTAARWYRVNETGGSATYVLGYTLT